MTELQLQLESTITSTTITTAAAAPTTNYTLLTMVSQYEQSIMHSENQSVFTVSEKSCQLSETPTVQYSQPTGMCYCSVEAM